MPLGPASVGTLAATPVEFIHVKHHLKDRSDGFILQIVKAGPIHFTHVRGKRAYDTGWAHFVDQERPLRGLGLRHVSIRNIAVGAHAVKTLVAHPEDLAGHPGSPGTRTPLARRLRAITHGPRRTPVIRFGPDRRRSLLDLVAAALGPTVEAEEIVAKRGVKAARLRAILAEIALRFSDPEFDLDALVGTLSRRSSNCSRRPEVLHRALGGTPA